MIKAILLMSGYGTRFCSETPKQFHKLAGKRVYLHTLERFLESKAFQEIVLVSCEQWIPIVQQEVASYRAPIRIIKGGKTRQESSFLGLLACSAQTTLVVIHDAVRPFVSLEIIRNNVTAAQHFGAVDTCIPSTDTLVHAPSNTTIKTIPNRSEYFRGQTPQSFSYPLILKAHQKAKEKEASDDCSLILDCKIPVHIIAGSEDNIKITTELDLFLAEQLLRLQHKKVGPPSCSLHGKKIAITGGTGGIGQAIEHLLRREGAEPLLIARTAPLFPCDLTSSEATKNIFEKIGAIDALINCIGLLKRQDFITLNNSDIEEQVRVNLLGPLYSCRHALIKQGGHVINVSSSSYSRGRKGYSIYASAKAALVNFTQSFAEEREDLKINVVVPSRTYTKMRTFNFPEENPELLLNPLEVAEVIVELLKDEHTTGSIIEVKKKSG